MQALAYGKGAASVNACHFTITADHTAKDLARLLPFVGQTIAETICEVVATGTCTLLEDMRANRHITHKGHLVQGTEGAATRRQFCKLPGVGNATAKE